MKTVLVLVFGFALGYVVFHQTETKTALDKGAHIVDKAQKLAPKVSDQVSSDVKELQK
jgi:hypothetical protein